MKRHLFSKPLTCCSRELGFDVVNFVPNSVSNKWNSEKESFFQSFLMFILHIYTQMYSTSPHHKPKKIKTEESEVRWGEAHFISERWNWFWDLSSRLSLSRRQKERFWFSLSSVWFLHRRREKAFISCVCYVPLSPLHLMHALFPISFGFQWCSRYEATLLYRLSESRSKGFLALHCRSMRNGCFCFLWSSLRRFLWMSGAVVESPIGGRDIGGSVLLRYGDRYEYGSGDGNGKTKKLRVWIRQIYISIKILYMYIYIVKNKKISL